MIEEKTILIGSVLKPIDDTRTYEKIGKSLSKVDGYKVSIFGLKSSENIKDNEVDFFPQPTFPRISFSRIKVRMKFYKTCLKVKPDIIIVNTHELLGVMCLFKILFGCKTIYDIQENYFLNLWHGNAFPRLIRPFLATWVRLKETLTSPFINHFLLAEKSYESELGFIGNRYTILENKFVFPEGFHPKPRPSVSKKNYKIVYTGTISEVYGIYDAIDFFKLFLDHYPNSQFTIIGYSSSKKTLRRLNSVISNDPTINLVGGEELVPHVEILNCIQESDLAIVPYHLNKSIVSCFPTKLWEYMTLKVPFIMKSDLPWVPYCKQYNACVEVDFESPDWKKFDNDLNRNDFYSQVPETQFLWLEQEKALFSSISNII